MSLKRLAHVNIFLTLSGPLDLILSLSHLNHFHLLEKRYIVSANFLMVTKSTAQGISD